MRRLNLVLIGLALAASLMLQGCEEEELVRPDRNRPPETILSVGPREGDRVFHKYRVRWTGLDRDGVVVAYRVATVAEDEIYNGRTSPEDIAEYLLDLPWWTTDATDSLFVFRADRPNSRNHSIYVAAIDNEGKEDPTPALANFLAIDYGLPEISICMACNVPRYSEVLKSIVPPGVCAPTAMKGDTLPQYNLADPGSPIIITLKWEGDDPDGDIVWWIHRLDSRGEVTDSADVDSLVLIYDPDDPVQSDVRIGFHEFRLSAVDDANARSAEKSTRFVINYDPDTVIDSVWSFRQFTDLGEFIPNPLPKKLIYARAWSDSPEVYPDEDRVGYHFGQLILKFHGTDKDKPLDGLPPDTFKWNIAGTYLKSDWLSNPCGQSDSVYFYCDTTPFEPFLDNDQPFRLLVYARDHVDKADGSPAVITFEVNVTPVIESIVADTLGLLAGQVTFTWQAHDVDEGYGWGVETGETEQALIKYRYRIDGGLWEQVTAKTRNPTRYKKTVTVDGIEPGHHTFELHAYNGDYIATRADTLSIEFDR